MIKYNINFSKFYKSFNILSIVLIIFSILFLIFKGLNYGVDFKGGTLIEIRSLDNNIGIADIRKSFNKLNLGDVNVKEFGKKNDYIVKFEKKKTSDEKFIENIKNELKKDIGNIFEFRRVESVGPKVSAELLKSGIIAIALSLGAMLIYIWIRFEWQFSLGAIAAVFHDVIITLGFFSLYRS
jgi:Preprotein translocase subunit SecF